MKIDLCDVCLAEGKVKTGKRRIGFRSPHRKVTVCDDHRSWGAEYKTDAEAWDKAVFELEGRGLECLRTM